MNIENYTNKDWGLYWIEKSKENIKLSNIGEALKDLKKAKFFLKNDIEEIYYPNDSKLL